ncbi:MAG: hypothetical protein H7833_15995 [Magnetococcus sp. DMHC-1]|nr:hypothetical protein [Magnetococcales bacterium]
MITREMIQQAVFATIDEWNQHMPVNRQMAKSTAVILLGPSGVLDSLGLINFAVSLEERLAELFGAPVTIFREEYLQQETSPFRTIASLLDHIETVSHDSLID